ncbi:ABC transporter substrate-binding protein [Roseitranquillus sediminis]|uniref:ABC transporter substrate-binding protein n=1 Tax=Roseitranquillus sediminis TaxID=2809051 RepID=UPI001D0CA936|nr:ABC transporter substrate-binding protein [Roseitranquillus sediminis]MBM9594700.1 ABC transporter substrate-binding protein [Roseitranquillus sediminis]
MKQVWLASVIAGASALMQPAAADAQELTVGVAGEMTALDPLFQNVSTNSQLHMMMFEPLVGRDHQAQTFPLLAESWELVDDTTWEFKLRPGVTFHNGEELTSEDVVFTIERIPTIEGSPGPYTTYISSIADVEAVDPQTVRFTTHAPNPVLPLDLSAIFIVNQDATEGATQADFASGEAMVGTGPYKFESHLPREALTVSRYEDYWGEPGEWERINVRMLTNDAARVAALLAGEVDLIDQVPPSNIPRIEQQEELKVARFPALRSIFLALDQTGDGPFAFDNEGNELPDDVFQDRRVREALSIAIDRSAIVDRVLEGAAFASGQFMPEGAPGYVADIEPPAYDPERAKELLAEAGYPEGFKLTIHGPNSHYPGDVGIIQAVAQYWNRIGVETEVVVQPFAGFLGRAANQEFSSWLASWGSSTGEAGNTLRSLVQTYDEEAGVGAANRHRYSNPELDAKIELVSTTMGEEERLQHMEDAIRLAFEQVAVIPILVLQNVWAMRSDLEVEGRIDARVYPHDVRSTD